MRMDKLSRARGVLGAFCKRSLRTGDSGGGVYYDGVLVGNTYAIKRGVVLVALNPGFVTSGDWQWMERNEWWRNDPR